MPLEDRLERLKQLLALHEGWLDAARIRCAVGKKEGEWWNLRCDVVAFPRGVLRTKEPSRSYPSTLLLEDWAEPARLPDLIVAASGGVAGIGGVKVRFAELFEDSLPVQDALPPLLFDSPVYRIIFPFAIACPTDHQPLIARGSKFYPNGSVAAVEWCETDTFEYRRPEGGIIVRLPQCRARFDKLVAVDKTLHVFVQGDKATLAGGMLKGAGWSPTAYKDIEHVGLAPGERVSIELPEAANNLELRLVDAAGETLDRHIEGPGVDPWRTRVLSAAGDIPAVTIVRPGATAVAREATSPRCTVFYSWQSQLPNATNRGFIEDALVRAAKAVRDDVTIDARPEIDRDTKGKPGAPNIADTIRAKIDAAEVVVCDVSLVQGTRRLERWLGGRRVRPTPNPNVLIELGYAVKSLATTDRLILVMNTAYGEVEDLPFDLRQHRPTTYHLPEGETGGKADVRKRLVSALEATLRHVLVLPSRRVTYELARCGSVYWLSNNLVFTALALSRGNVPGALREWNHAIHHAQQLPVPGELLGRLRALQNRNFVHDAVERERVIAELQALWTEVGRFMGDQQPDFVERDVQRDME